MIHLLSLYSDIVDMSNMLNDMEQIVAKKYHVYIDTEKTRKKQERIPVK